MQTVLERPTSTQKEKPTRPVPLPVSKPLPTPDILQLLETRRNPSGE